MKTDQQRIEEILNEFDFQRVRKVMEALDWKWYGVSGVPSMYQMAKLSERLLQDCLDGLEENNEYTTATGGFEARAWRYGQVVVLELNFVVTSWSSE